MREEQINYESLGDFEEVKIKHLRKTIEEIKGEKQLIVEMDTLLRFYKTSQKSMQTFLQELYKGCLEFQTNITQLPHVDQMSQFFQTLMNFFINFHLSLEKKFELVDCEIQRLSSLKQNYSNIKKTLLAQMSDTKPLESKLESFRQTYATYLQLSLRPTEPEQTQESLDSFRRSSLGFYEEFQDETQKHYEVVQRKLDEIIDQEAIIKETMKSSIM